MEQIEKKPKVSVCVVTYNQEEYIRQCLQSIVEQETEFDFEVIVSDDCSTDKTQAIVQEFKILYPNIIKPHYHLKNIGPYKNFLYVHNQVKGDYVAHIDGDDLMLPRKLKKQVEFLDQHADFSVVWHRSNLFDDKGGFFPGEEYDLSIFHDGIVTLEHSLRLGSVCAHSSTMYRRIARKTYEHDFNTLDLFYAWEYLCSGKGKILDDVLGAYRVSAKGSISSGLNIRKLYAHHARYYLKILPGQKKNIFIFALVNFLRDIKNRRKTAWDFAALLWTSACFVSPLIIMKTILEGRCLIVHPLKYKK